MRILLARLSHKAQRSGRLSEDEAVIIDSLSQSDYNVCAGDPGADPATREWHMLFDRTGRAAALTACFLVLPAFVQAAGAGAMLDRLEPGYWELRTSAGASLGGICLRDPAALGQVQHRGADCSRDVVASNDRSAIVQYSCRGLGSGRTTIRFETPRLVQIDSQGLDQGTPFAIRAEARRTGACRAEPGATAR